MKGGRPKGKGGTVFINNTDGENNTDKKNIVVYSGLKPDDMPLIIPPGQCRKYEWVEGQTGPTKIKIGAAAAGEEEEGEDGAQEKSYSVGPKAGAPPDADDDARYHRNVWGFEKNQIKLLTDSATSLQAGKACELVKWPLSEEDL
ncbi:MAG: hypothetical protein CMD29_05240 [Flavobacteriales bacterium]|nr:hypothetical protein [Flavobacteriales bacterium]|tara:strand:- start:2 stop:436 length:435 start_codon:yes stop_codon:yes gene_type:complete